MGKIPDSLIVDQQKRIWAAVSLALGFLIIGYVLFKSKCSFIKASPISNQENSSINSTTQPTNSSINSSLNPTVIIPKVRTQQDNIDETIKLFDNGIEVTGFTEVGFFKTARIDLVDKLTNNLQVAAIPPDSIVLKSVKSVLFTDLSMFGRENEADVEGYIFRYEYHHSQGWTIYHINAVPNSITTVIDYFCPEIEAPIINI